MGGLLSSPEKRFQRKVRALVESTLDVGASRDSSKEWANPDNFIDEPNFHNAFKDAGVESCNLIVGIDFTRSNLWQGRNSFNGESLHALGSTRGPNPYQCALRAVASSLKSFDEDGSVPAFVFGDVETRHSSIRPLARGSPALSLQSLENAYCKAAAAAQLSGPTSFAPLIDHSIELVRESGGRFHILLILADGCVDDTLDCLNQTRDAICRASEVPLVIVMVGIGDGPWEVMKEFDDGLPERKFDNFQFVAFSKFHELLRTGDNADQERLVDTAFMICALQEVPAQHTAIRRLGLLGDGDGPPTKRQRLGDVVRA